MSAIMVDENRISRTKHEARIAHDLERHAHGCEDRKETGPGAARNKSIPELLVAPEVDAAQKGSVQVATFVRPHERCLEV